MTTVLPHSAVVHQHLRAYLADLGDEVAACVCTLPSISPFRTVFKTSLSAYAVLSVFARRELVLVRAAAGIARRLPLLLAVRQVSLAYVELRRFLEVVIWFPYFREHGLEWEEFLRTPLIGAIRDPEKPIAQAAHQGVGWYLAYSKERFSRESSGLAAGAVEALSRLYPKLCAHVHAAYGATRGDLSKPFDNCSSSAIGVFARLQRETLAAGCLTVAAARPDGMARLDAVERAWLDWLIGTARSKKLRSTAFGHFDHAP